MFDPFTAPIVHGRFIYFASMRGILYKINTDNMRLQNTPDMKEKGIACWLDVKMAERDLKAMEEGINNSNIFLVIMSLSYFKSDFCIKELERAAAFSMVMSSTENTFDTI